MSKLSELEEWGRFVFAWRDGKLIRHPRCRQWLLDTGLRTMAFDVQGAFFETWVAATQCAPGELLERKNSRPATVHYDEPMARKSR